MTGWLPDPEPVGLVRRYAVDYAAAVLEPRVACPATGERLAASEACYTTCFLGTCTDSPQWTEPAR